MRRVLTLLLTVAMMLSLIVVASADTQTVKLKVEETGKTDTTVTYTITLDATNCDGVAALQFTLKPTGMEQDGEATLTSFRKEFNLDNSNPNKKGSYGFTSGKYVAYGGNIDDGVGLMGGKEYTIMTITYTITGASHSLAVEEFKACRDGDQAMNNPYTISTDTGDTNVKKGDINGDGTVNIKDRIILIRYLAKWSDYQNEIVKGEASFEAADINNDGVVNIKDRIILVRYLAKWHGEYDSYFE